LLSDAVHAFGKAAFFLKRFCLRFNLLVQQVRAQVNQRQCSIGRQAGTEGCGGFGNPGRCPGLIYYSPSDCFDEIGPFPIKSGFGMTILLFLHIIFII
jgi:hypothetical protein